MPRQDVFRRQFITYIIILISTYYRYAIMQTLINFCGYSLQTQSWKKTKCIWSWMCLNPFRCGFMRFKKNLSWRRLYDATTLGRLLSTLTMIFLSYNNKTKYYMNYNNNKKKTTNELLRRQQSWFRWCVRSACCRVRERRQTIPTRDGGRAVARERVDRVCFDRLKRERKSQTASAQCAYRRQVARPTGGNAIWRHNSVETKSLNLSWWNGYLKPRFRPCLRRWGGIILSYN